MSARILIIEDDEAILKFLRRGLAYEGYQVDTATEGQSVWLWRAITHPIWLCGFDAAGIDGLEVCRRLRAGGPVPILILTPKILSMTAFRPGYGADDYMVKPFNLDELLARIRALLRRAQPAGHSAALRRLVSRHRHPSGLPWRPRHLPDCEGI